VANWLVMNVQRVLQLLTVAIAAVLIAIAGTGNMPNTVTDATGIEGAVSQFVE
jgi:hypothetical protein